MPEAWRAVAGAVAEATAPVRMVGDSLLRMPVATGMLMVVGRVFSEPGRKGIITCGHRIARTFWFGQGVGWHGWTGWIGLRWDCGFRQSSEAGFAGFYDLAGLGEVHHKTVPILKIR